MDIRHICHSHRVIMGTTFQQKVIAAFALVMFLIFGFIGVALKQFKVLKETQEILVQSYDAQISLEQIISNINAAESNHLGYLLVGKEEYLDSYENSLSSLELQLNTLESFFQSDAELRSDFQKLASLINQKLTELNATITLRRTKGFASTLSVLESNKSKQVTDNIHGTAESLRKNIAGDIPGQIANISNIYNQTLTLIVGITSTSIIVLSFLFAFVQKEINHRLKAEDILSQEKNILTAEKKKTNAILHSIGDGVFVIDTEKKITVFNQRAEELTGYKREEALGKNYQDILQFTDEETGDSAIDFIEKALRYGKNTELDSYSLLRNKHGVQMPVANNATPLRSENNKIDGAVVIFRNISREREIDKAKTEFVSLASHQLRTPLSAMNWYLEMLLAGDAGTLTNDQKEYIQEVYTSNKRMVELVNALLNVSRIDLGSFTITPTPTNLIEIADDLLREFRTLFKQKNINIETHYSKKLLMYNTDPQLMRIILQNLIVNALKYTPEKGKISLTIKKQTKDKQLAIIISDTGFGIPKSEQHHIFTKLYRAENIRMLETSGTGLGLYIVKSIVDAAGGSIWFESEENKGTTFYIQLPLQGMKQRNGSKELSYLS